LKLNEHEFNWESIPLPLYLLEDAKTIYFLQTLFPLNISIYHIKYCERWSCIQKMYSYPCPNAIQSLNFFFVENHWSLMIENYKKQLKILNRFKCSTCFNWIPAKDELIFLKKHFKTCRKCVCDQCYKEGDVHPVLCNKISGKKNKKKLNKNECKIQQISKKAYYQHHNHMADFECFHSPAGFEVYSCGLYNSESKKVKLWCGKDALKNFFEYIQRKIEGVIWFFNGGKFDNFFILKYCILNHIPIERDFSLIRGNSIPILAIKSNLGKKSRIIIKDLAKFLSGSLDSLCKAFQVKESKSKKVFDHDKIKSWDDVEYHKKEHLKYLKYDVISQNEVYLSASKSVFDLYHINLCDFVSISQMSFSAATQYILPGRLLKVERKFEPFFREAYFGGRIVMTTPFYYSSVYDFIKDLSPSLYNNTIFESIQDYVHYFDKNSLYPYQMLVEKYPCGKFYLREDWDEEDAKIKADLLTKEANGEQDYDFWIGCLVQVSITTPTDIYVPFLMSRDIHGNNQQILENIDKKWYAGAEILEAVRLGYTVSAVHAYICFEHFEALFKEFISSSYKARMEAKEIGKQLGLKDGGPKDLMTKHMMNGASGKPAQHCFDTSEVIYIGEELRNVMITEDSKIIWDLNLENMLAIIQKEKKEVEFTPFPLYLTIWILAYSRVCMSKFMKLIDGYRNKENVPIYGDTDSLLTKHSAIMNIDPKEFGSEIGQMKDEKPDCKIIAVIILAPKTYMMMYLKKGKEGVQLYTQLKCKGIPHTNDDYLYHSDYSVDQKTKEKALQVYDFLNNRNSSNDFFEKVGLKDRFYLTEYKDGRKIVETRITWNNMLACSEGKAKIICIFGGMIRNLSNTSHIEKMGIHLDYYYRSLVEETWWNRGKRFFLKEENMFVPTGFSK